MFGKMMARARRRVPAFGGMRSALVATAVGLLLSGLSTAAAREPLHERVVERARALAGEPYAPPDQEALPRELRDLTYSQYRNIRFDKDRALWKGESLFNVELFHPGFLYHQPVIIHEVAGDDVRTLPYEHVLFEFGGKEALREVSDPGLGFAGLRIHYPINTAAYKDELLVFLGASYFRMVGRGQTYGLSGRGLAVNTAASTGEEFPRFTEFWLERPASDATSLVIHALMDSESVTGAYRFELHPRGDTELEVEARLFARADIERLGMAPLTSMFLYGSNRVRHYDDFRPQVHDSDGLLAHTGAGEWIWRPLTNPVRLQVVALLDQDVRGFGLLQRERDFVHYLDMEARYENRPGLWVEPRDDWGRGAVQLVEIPTADETNDNIVAFWVPEDPLEAGQERAFRYVLRTTGSEGTPPRLATVQRTRIGSAAIPGASEPPPRSHRRFIIDFEGGELGGLDPSQPMEPELTVSSGRVTDLVAQPLPNGAGWRVAFQLAPQGSDPADMRLFLGLRGQRLSETWNYVWTPEMLR